MKTIDVGELRETREVDEANEWLALGWKLLKIVCDRRGRFFILGARTALDFTESPVPALPQNN